jgi:hypothetical protein
VAPNSVRHTITTNTHRKYLYNSDKPFRKNVELFSSTWKKVRAKAVAAGSHVQIIWLSRTGSGLEQKTQNAVLEF